MKKCHALSHHEFVASMEEAKVDDTNVESKKSALIEIMGQYDLGYMPWHFKEDHSNVLRITFDDVDKIINIGLSHRLAGGKEDRFAYPMTEEQGKTILDFIRANEDKDNFIIHCAAGISRSGAVAKFANELFGGEERDYWAVNPYTHPNARILGILRNLSQTHAKD